MADETTTAESSDLIAVDVGKLKDVLEPAVAPVEPAVASVEPAVVVPVITGNIPTTIDAVSGTVRLTAVIDLVYADGALTEVGFNAAQYHAFPVSGGLAIKSTFPKPTK